MRNDEFNVDFYEVDGVFFASIGKYVRYTATHFDDEGRLWLSSLANQRANLIMEAADTGLLKPFDGDPVLMSIVKEDLMRHIKTPNC